MPAWICVLNQRLACSAGWRAGVLGRVRRGVCRKGHSAALRRHHINIESGAQNAAGPLERPAASCSRRGLGFACVVARETRQFHHQRRVAHTHAAGQARIGVHAPGVVGCRSSSLVCRCQVAAPCRTCTWQVEQAQTFSQACSMATPCASNSSPACGPGALQTPGLAGTTRRGAAGAPGWWRTQAWWCRAW